jgi:hypothetical protein
MDDESAASLATEHLIALGHTRIGFIAGPEDYELSAWRIDGWRKTMLAAGLADDLLARGDFGYASGRDAAIALLDAADPATAIIASNDQMALATLETCRNRGIEVPRDLSLVSFDNTPIVRFTHPRSRRLISRSPIWRRRLSNSSSPSLRGATRQASRSSFPRRSNCANRPPRVTGAMPEQIVKHSADGRREWHRFRSDGRWAPPHDRACLSHQRGHSAPLPLKD